MKILFMGQHYAPEDVSGAVLATELAIDLAKRGHEVTIVTCFPNYPEGRVFPGYKLHLYQKEILDGVQVVRTWSYICPRKTFWRRILNYGTFSAVAFFGGLLVDRPDVVVSFSPPLPLGVSAWLLSRLWRVPWVLRVEDLYPEVAVAAGVLHSHSVIAFLSALERFLYQQATHISLISEGFRRNLLGKGISAQKLSVIPVWADPDVVRPLPKENCFRRDHGLEGRFVVMYAGNIGHTSALEDVIVAAEILRDQPDVRFVIVGEGIKKQALADLVEHKGLENVLFLPFQPRTVFAEMLAAADIGLVTLSPGFSSTSLPSKTFNIMASGRPIVAITPLDSEIAQLVQEADCGVPVPPDHPERLAEVLLELKDDTSRLTDMGRNGRLQLESRFSRRRCVDLYEKTLTQVTT